tara:strand:- start:2052 stop:2570 length:519 start_codon:yes stop_codon:yes gene_type:complete
LIEVIDDFFPRRLVQEGFYYLDSYNDWDHLADSPENAHAYTLGKAFEYPNFEPVADKFFKLLDIEARKCLYNCFRHSDCPKAHVDSNVDHGVTYLIYLNLDWDINMGGETVFIEEDTGDILKAVAPHPGRMIKFQSVIPHMARPPVRDAFPRRYSLVFQTHPCDDIHLGDLL